MRIVNDIPRAGPADLLIFEAEDDSGPFQLWVPVELWERLRADSSLAYDAEDQRDYGLSILEATSSGGEPVTAPSG